MIDQRTGRRGVLAFLGFLGIDGRAAAAVPTPEQTAGPFYPPPNQRPQDTDWDLVKMESRVRDAGDEVLHLSGRVLDRDGAPLANALVEIWQCDGNGRYHHVGDRSSDRPLDKDLQGFGAIRTDAEGRHRFRTIKPIPYPRRTPYIHARVVLRERRELVTQIYLDDHPLNHPTRNKDWSQSYGVTWDDSSQGAELYDGFIAAAVAEAIEPNAARYCWHASRRQALLEACWERAGAFVHQQIIWVKDRGVLTRSHYLWKHEPCFMGWVRPNRPPKVADETLASAWELPSFHRDDRPDHQTPKPLDCFGIPMRQHVARGGLCYEPFSGSGSQIMAGEANGRRVFAMEISPAYVDVAVERWQAETGRAAVLDGDGRNFAEVREERVGTASAEADGQVDEADPPAEAVTRGKRRKAT